MKKKYVSPLFAELELVLEDVLFESGNEFENAEEDIWNNEDNDFDDEEEFGF